MCENEATEDEDEVDAEVDAEAEAEAEAENEDDESEKDVEQLGDAEDLPPLVSAKNEDDELTSATVAAVRAGANEISYLFLCKRVLRFLRRRFEHFYDTPAAVAATRDTLMPLLYSPNPTTATLAAVALRGLANAAPRRYRARLARALAVPVYKALLAAPLTSTMLVGALADCLDRCCTVSQRAAYEMFAVGSPVAVPLPSASAVVATENDKKYRDDSVPSDDDNDCADASPDDDASSVCDGKKQRSNCKSCAFDDFAVDLLPDSFDDCAEIKLLRLAERALRTMPCTESSYSDMIVSLVGASAVAMENRRYESFVITNLIQERCISRHYAVSRLAALSFAIAPLAGLVCTAMLGDTTACIVHEDDAEAAGAKSKAAAAADASARAKRDSYVTKADNKRRLQQVLEISYSLMNMLGISNTFTGLKLPFEKPEWNYAFLFEDFNSALWENTEHVMDAWREACSAAAAAVRASVAPGVAAQIAEVRKREEANLRTSNKAFTAYVNTLAVEDAPLLVDLLAQALAASLSADVMAASVMSLLPLLPVVPVKYFGTQVYP